jgi:hypothetical protein
VVGTRHVTRIALLSGAVLVALSAAVIYYVVFVRPNTAIGQAQAWTVLQSVELQHRTDADSASPLLLPNPLHSRYTVLGLPTGNARLPRAWIILNQWTPNSPLKMIPATAHVHVTCGYVEQVLRSADVEQAVKRFLRSRCVPIATLHP